MDTATARRRLESMLQVDVAPTLSTEEVDDLLLQSLRTDANGYTPYSIWAASTIYTANTYRVPVVNNGHQYIVTTAGTSGSTEPTWPTDSGGTVTDGTVVWTERGQYLYTSTWDLRAAASEGWRWKAAKVVSEYNVATGGGTSFQRSQKYEHCMAMAREFSRGGIGVVQLQGSYARRWGT